MEVFDISNILKERLAIPKKKTGSERGTLLEEMLLEVNKERTGKWKPMSIKLFAIRMGGRKIQKLYELHSKAKDYKNRQGSYSKYLFGSIKCKNKQK